MNRPIGMFISEKFEFLRDFLLYSITECRGRLNIYIKTNFPSKLAHTSNSFMFVWCLFFIREKIRLKMHVINIYEGGKITVDYLYSVDEEEEVFILLILFVFCCKFVALFNFSSVNSHLVELLMDLVLRLWLQVILLNFISNLAQYHISKAVWPITHLRQQLLVIRTLNSHRCIKVSVKH